MAKILVEQRAGNLEDMERNDTAYYNANKDLFVSGMLSDMNIDAAASFQYKQIWVNERERIDHLRRNIHGEETLDSVNIAKTILVIERCVRVTEDTRDGYQNILDILLRGSINR